MDFHIQPQPDAQEIEKLCRAAADGDAQALERLLWRCHERLLSCARRKVGVDWHGKIDAEDVLQEAYVEAFRSIAGFEPRGDDAFYRWMVRIVEHRFLDHVRRWRRKKRDAAREAQPRASRDRATALAGLLATLTTPSVALRREDAVAALMSCIARLPDDYRLAIHRLYLLQDPLSAVAADWGRTDDAVRRLASRAVEKLQQCMGRASKYLSLDR